MFASPVSSFGRSASAWLAISGALLAQATATAPAPAAPSTVAATEDVVTEAAVREVVSFLASDELMGRDTPSPGLTRAAEFLADRFAAAGLDQAVPESWLHRYTLKGQRLDSRSIKATLRIVKGETEQVVELVPDEDVRLLRAGEIAAGSGESALVAPGGDPRIGRMLMADAGRRPVLLEVAADSMQWKIAAGERELLARRMRGTSPVFLVRKGALPTLERVEDHSFLLDWSITAPEAIDVELPNVIGVLRGSQKPDEYVLVSAHFDHVGVGTAVDGDAIYNGADDDATGTTAVVLIAEALAKQPRPARSIAFVCFSAEEKGLRGSAEFAANPPFPLQSIVANLNIEMIGRPMEDKRFHAWITGSEFSDFAAIVAASLSGTGVALTEFEMASRLFAASDNYSFARHGVIAHSISAGSLHADYHQPSDEVEKLDIEHMTKVVRALAKVTWDLADRPAPPAYNEAGRKRLKLSPR